MKHPATYIILLITLLSGAIAIAIAGNENTSAETQNSITSDCQLHQPQNDQTIDQLQNEHIKSLLDSVCFAISQQNWKLFVSYCDTENYQAQRKIGIEIPQYIYEILNLETTGGGSYLNRIDATMSSRLTMEIRSFHKTVEASRVEYDFSGIITIDGTTEIDFHFLLYDKGHALKIIGGFG
jgi:hypothetical protein